MLLQAAVEYGAIASGGRGALSAVQAGAWWPWAAVLLLAIFGLWLSAGTGGFSRIVGLCSLAGAVYLAITSR